MLLTVIVFIFILGLLIFVHEFGHFWAARLNGVKVEEFGFGFPPRIIKIQGKKTLFSINAIPFGGFVKLKGEKGENKEDPDSFAAQKIYKRALIVTAGVIANFLLAIFLLTIGFKIGLPQVIDQDLEKKAHIKDVKLMVVDTLSDSPAEKEGLKAGDFILEVEGIRINNVEKLQNLLKNNVGKEVEIVIERKGEKITKNILVAESSEEPKARIGVHLVKIGKVSYGLGYAFLEAIKTTFWVTYQIIKALFELIKNLIIVQKVTVDFAGPVGIAVITGEVTKMGFIYIIQFIALLSINLAIINILPIPALDGGRILFLIIEKIRGRAVNQKVEALIHNLAFFFLILLIILITFRDITRFSSQILGFFKKILP